MPPASNDTGKKKVSDLTADEIVAESQRISKRQQDIKDQIAAAQRLSASDLPASYQASRGKAPDEVIKDALNTHTGISTYGGLLPGVPRPMPNHPDLGKAKVSAGGPTILDLAKEFHDLDKRKGDINTRVQASPDLTNKATAAAQADKPGPVTSAPPDPLANFVPQFLDATSIENLARTGDLDFTPTKLASLFPSVDYQRAVAKYQADRQSALVNGTPEPTAPQHSLEDTSDPWIMHDQSVVNPGASNQFIQGATGVVDARQQQIDNIKKMNLPAWQQELMLNQIGQAPLTNTIETAKQAELNAADASTSSSIIRATKKAVILAKYGAMSPAMTGRTSLTDALQKPYDMTADQVGRLSTELFKAGYIDLGNKYDPTKPLSQQMHITSAFDPTFQKAYQEWLMDGMKDRTKGLDQIMADRQQSYMGQLAQYANMIREQKAQQAAALIKVDDPTAIRTSADTLAQQITGQKLNDDQHAQLVSYIHQLQINAQQQAIGLNAANQTGVVQDVDVNGQLQEAIRKMMPVESDANDIAHQYDVMSTLLAGPAGNMTGRIG